MKTTIAHRTSLLVLAPVTLAGAAWAQTDEGWPRPYKKDTHEVTVYQPQIGTWDKYEKLHFRMALVLRTAGVKEPAYGVMEGDANTFSEIPWSHPSG